ncbi:MAG: hypothetical protein H7210_07410 [Pyrinomonadaceae bacterium]|nr:hypothetical protein [Phycisphaerales bacterium]
MTWYSPTLNRCTRTVLGAAALLAAALPAAAQPANDNCASATAIGNGTFAGSTSNASNDGTASCGSSASSVDVWYRYTAASTASIRVTLCNAGTNYDAVVSVHSPACPGTSGTEIGCNDDTCNLQPQVDFAATAGAQYLIRVSGFNLNLGDFVMSVGPGGGVQPPANDECANATAIANGTFPGTSNNSTSDGASACGPALVGDVYYRYTAPATGAVNASTCSAGSFDTTISIHSACPATTANQIACNDNFCGVRSQVTFSAVAGTQYVVRVTGQTTGTFTLTMGDPPPPGTSGPDVTYQDLTDVASYGAVGGIRGYALGSSTCNIGDANLIWANRGSPALAMNAYRLHNGRLTQVGLGFCKTACCAAASSGCGSCNGAGGNVLGAGCRDVYGAGFNGIQAALSPRSTINGYTGTIASFSSPTGNAIFRRLQVAQADMTNANFPNALYFAEGQYIATDDQPAGNAMNNVSYKRVTINQSTFDWTGNGSMNIGIPAIRAWRDNGLGVGVPDPSVSIFSVDVPSEGRFWVATKVTTLGENRYLYDYAVFNQNSDRSGGSLSVPRAFGVNVSGVGFSDVNYHSGEPYDNTDWVSAANPGSVDWRSPQTFAQNPNSNALRWGTMYNFWFEANTPPTTGTVTLGLFKTADSVAFKATVPSAGCTSDWNQDGTVNSQDFFDFVADFFNDNADFNSDGVTNSQDFFDFVGAFFTPCK